jgi:hypothetical protein
VFVESKAGFMLNNTPFYFLPWSLPRGDGRIAGKAVQIEQGNVKKLIANKIDLTVFPGSFLGLQCLSKGGNGNERTIRDGTFALPVAEHISDDRRSTHAET